MLKNVVTVKPFVPEPPKSETPEKPEDKYKSSWIYKYFVWIEVVLVIGGILPTHRPKQRWRRYLMYIYISFMCMLHLFNLGRSVSLAFITTLGLTSNMMLVSSYLMTLVLVMSTSRRSKYIRPFLQDFTKLYQNGTIPICNYKKSFIMMSKFCAASTVIGLTLIFILFTINLYLSYYINPFFQLLIAPLTFDDPITVKVAYLFVLLVALSMPSFTAPCWLFVSVTFVLYKEYKHVNQLIMKNVKDKTIKGKIEEFRLHHENLNALLEHADDILNGVTGIFSISVIGLFCLAAYEVAGGVRNIYIFLGLLFNLTVIIILWFVIIYGSIVLNDQVNNNFEASIGIKSLNFSIHLCLFPCRLIHARKICIRSKCIH